MKWIDINLFKSQWPYFGHIEVTGNIFIYTLCICKYQSQKRKRTKIVYLIFMNTCFNIYSFCFNIFYGYQTFHFENIILDEWGQFQIFIVNWIEI